MNFNEVIAPFATLDLSTVSTRLMHPRAGLGWSAARTRAAESDYREFLLHAKLCPEENGAPTPDVDCFWHFHILDTVHYARDCQRLFGYFLHHEPDVRFDEEAQRVSVGHAALSYCARSAQSATMGYCARVAQPTPARAAALLDGAGAERAEACCAIARPQTTTPLGVCEAAL